MIFGSYDSVNVCHFQIPGQSLYTDLYKEI